MKTTYTPYNLRMTFYWILFLRNVVQLRSVVTAGWVISRGQFSPIPVTTSFTLYYSLPVFLFRCSLFTATLIPLFVSAVVYLIRRFLFAVPLFSPSFSLSPLLFRIADAATFVQHYRNIALETLYSFRTGK